LTERRDESVRLRLSRGSLYNDHVERPALATEAQAELLAHHRGEAGKVSLLEVAVAWSSSNFCDDSRKTS
jgi:hypothetical protein